MHTTCIFEHASRDCKYTANLQKDILLSHAHLCACKEPHWEMWHFRKGKSCSLLKIRLFFFLQFIIGLKTWSSPKLQIFVIIINIKDSSQTSLREKIQPCSIAHNCCLCSSSTRSQGSGVHSELYRVTVSEFLSCSTIDDDSGRACFAWMSSTCSHSLPFPTAQLCASTFLANTHSFPLWTHQQAPSSHQPRRSVQALKQAARQLGQGDIEVSDTHICILNTTTDVNLNSLLHRRRFSSLQRC